MRHYSRALRRRYGHADVPYAVAKAARNIIDAEVTALGNRLDAYPKGPTGLTPDAAKDAAWHETKAALTKAFRRLQDFNTQFVRTYRKEIAAERAARRGTR